VFARCMRDTVFSILTEPEDITYNWIVNAGFGYDIASSMITEKEGVIFIATKNGLIFSLDRFDGSLIWKYKFENTLIHSIAPLSRNQLFFTNMDGKIVSLKYYN
jgi:outer membrane protein assembly factor BamB